MSKGYIIGGGGSTKLYACIGVTYPSGATCTCTNGTKTLKAKGTSGTAIFNVPSTGTWAVTATNGDKTASKSVSITAEGQTVVVELIYALYNKGEQGVAWEVYSKEAYGEVTFASDAIQVRYTNSSGGVTGTVVNTVEPIDLTDISTLTVKMNKTTTTVYNVGVVKSKFTYSSIGRDVYAAWVDTNQKTGDLTLTVDVSSLTGSYYVAFCGYAATVDITYVNVS